MFLGIQLETASEWASTEACTYYIPMLHISPAHPQSSGMCTGTQLLTNTEIREINRFYFSHLLQARIGPHATLTDTPDTLEMNGYHAAVNYK